MPIPLSEYLKTHTQTETALKLGITQGAVWRWTLGDRDIVIEEFDDGSIRAFERKELGRRKAANA